MLLMLLEALVVLSPDGWRALGAAKAELLWSKVVSTSREPRDGLNWVCDTTLSYFICKTVAIWAASLIWRCHWHAYCSWNLLLPHPCTPIPWWGDPVPLSQALLPWGVAAGGIMEIKLMSVWGIMPWSSAPKCSWRFLLPQLKPCQALMPGNGNFHP